MGSALLAGALAACTTVGDLGRPKPVSSFVAMQDNAINETDEERQMRDRIWRFLQAPHAKAWFARRQREVSAYYIWLTGADFRSSHTRFNAIAADVDADLATIPATFEAVCAVEEIDRRRGVALAGLGLAPEMATAVDARRASNAAEVDRLTDALEFRLQSYGYALDRLLVETPHEEARRADDKLNELALFVRRADRDEFCRPAVTLGPVD